MNSLKGYSNPQCPPSHITACKLWPYKTRASKFSSALPTTKDNGSYNTFHNHRIDSQIKY